MIITAIMLGALALAMASAALALQLERGLTGGKRPTQAQLHEQQQEDRLRQGLANLMAYDIPGKEEK